MVAYTPCFPEFSDIYSAARNAYEYAILNETVHHVLNEQKGYSELLCELSGSRKFISGFKTAVFEQVEQIVSYLGVFVRHQFHGTSNHFTGFAKVRISPSPCG